jgi:AcrR family transcriptional regulator
MRPDFADGIGDRGIIHKAQVEREERRFSSIRALLRERLVCGALPCTLRVPLRTRKVRSVPSLVGEHPEVEPLLDARDGAQRARLLEAMTQVVGTKGYAAATVADAVRLARVSRSTFYALFDSKEACFVEAYRHGVDVLMQRLDAAVAAEPGDWRAKLRAAMRAYLVVLETEPRFARTHLIEIHTAGPAAGLARDDAIRRFAERYRATFAAAGGSAIVVSDDALFVLAAGIGQLVCAQLHEGAALTALEDTLVDCSLTLGGHPPWT